MIQFIKNLILSHRIKKAVNMAKMLSEKGRKKYIVLMVAGVPRVYSKQELKVLVKRRIFKRGTTIQDLEKKALFITN